MSDSEIALLSERSLTVVAQALYEHDQKMRNYGLSWLLLGREVQDEYMDQARVAVKAVFGLYTDTSEW